MTKIQITPLYRDVKPTAHYVYIHLRASTLEPFYVGMGQADRGWQYGASHRTEWWRRVALKNGVLVVVAQCGMDRDSANLLEMWLIAKFRHEGKSLVNLSSGGSGKGEYGREVYSSDGEAYRTMQEAANHMRMIGWPSASASAIYNCATGKTRVSYDRIWSFDVLGKFETRTTKEVRSKIVSDRNMRSVIRSDGVKYESMSDAVYDLVVDGHIRASKSAICRACKSSRLSAYGYGWSYG